MNTETLQLFKDEYFSLMNCHDDYSRKREIVIHGVARLECDRDGSRHLRCQRLGAAVDRGSDLGWRRQPVVAAGTAQK